MLILSFCWSLFINSCIIETANKLKPKLSSGHDEISTKLLQETISEIIIPITHIINRSLESGIVPDQLKIANVIPIYKASDPDRLQNYRPISLLPAFSKLIEKIMYNKVMSFLNSNNILYKHQYGFRPKHSTIHPILHLINHCAKVNNANHHQSTMSIFCDLSKAFDVINHDILLKKLNFWGIRGSANKWFLNYLSGRKQYVEIENTKSGYQNIICGVPQGSILGPLLYLIYVNDISKSTNGHILSFADDTSLYVSDSDPDDLFNKANSMFASLFDWFCANRLSLNPTKTKYIVFRPQSKKCDFTGKVVSINGTPLNQIGAKFNDPATKFLGIYMDEHLTWKHHLAHINSKISRALFIIKQVKNILPVESLRTLYFALIHPFLSYGITMWGNASQSYLHKTVNLQKRAVRIINKAMHNSHTDPLFKKSEILKLSDLYEYQAALFMNDYVMARLPHSFRDSFRFNCDIQETYLTRQSNLLKIERCNSAFSAKFPIYKFPCIWNRWMPIVPRFTSRSHYKNEVKRNILSTYAATVKCTNSFCNDCQHG